MPRHQLTKEDCRRGGSIQGAANVESGHWDRISRLPNSGRFKSDDPRLADFADNAREHIDREHQKEVVSKMMLSGQAVAMGKISGRKSVENGHLDRIRPEPEIGGLAALAQQVGIHDPQNVTVVREGAAHGRHTRWHTNRGIRKDWCEYCYPEQKHSS